jgi:hypothetical protein
MPGQRPEDIYGRHVDLANRRFAVIEQERQFIQAPLRPVLERDLGKHVAGMAA